MHTVSIQRVAGSPVLGISASRITMTDSLTLRDWRFGLLEEDRAPAHEGPKAQRVRDSEVGSHRGIQRDLDEFKDEDMF
jgi:hypothetical protein